MNECYVCASALNPDDPVCPNCKTELAVLKRLERSVSRQRFLFSHAPIESQEENAKPAPLVRRKPKQAQKKAKPTVQPRIMMERDPLDLIKNRDVVPELPPEKQPLTRRGLAYLFDVMLCLLLNGIVLLFILNFIHRGLSDLVTFSLIPLLFVFLSFTVLYFYLFTGLLGRSLGHFFAERLIGKESRDFTPENP